MNYQRNPVMLRDARSVTGHSNNMRPCNGGATVSPNNIQGSEAVRRSITWHFELFIKTSFINLFILEKEKCHSHLKSYFKFGLSITIQSTKLDCNPVWAILQSNPVIPCVLFEWPLTTIPQVAKSLSWSRTVYLGIPNPMMPQEL